MMVMVVVPFRLLTLSALRLRGGLSLGRSRRPGRLNAGLQLGKRTLRLG